MNTEDKKLIPLKRFCLNLNNETPLCTILSLARCQGLKYDSSRELDELYVEAIINAILKIQNSPIEISKFSKEWTSHVWSLVSRFVNPLVDSWDPENLLTAYNYCHHNSDTQNYKSIIRSNSFGPKTNSDPKRIDEIEIYNLCLTYGIKTHRSISFNDMITSIKFISMDKFWTYILSVPCLDKISFVNAFNSNQKRDIIFNKGESCETFLEKNVKTTGIFLPTSHREAILAGLKYKVDFSLAENPLVEYFNLISSDKFPDCKYSPIGKLMKKVCRTNQLRVRFGRYFNPYIPCGYYSSEQLRYFSNRENIKISNLTEQKIYLKLQERSLMPNFHHLFQPEINKTETYFTRENFNEIEGVKIISYGILSYSADEMVNNVIHGYSFQELELCFKSTKKFEDPINNIVFSDYSIDKLYNICSSFLFASKISEEIKDDVRNLSQQIILIKEIKKGLDEKIKNWLSYRDNFENDMIQVLNLLLEFGMYMRSWSGPPEDYPISNNNSLDNITISINVTKSLNKFEDFNNSLPKAVQILNLPLVLYDKQRFNISKKTEEGFTIEERINIVKLGETTEDMTSCIRLSSNWLISSSYYYLQLLERRPNFDIEIMHHIQ